jgi:hypothetical protein
MTVPSIPCLCGSKLASYRLDPADARSRTVCHMCEATVASGQRPCPCGSGLASHWLKDARGIECARVCDACEARQRGRYRPEIFTDPNYETTEAIEPDDY